MTSLETWNTQPVAYLFDAGGLREEEIGHLRRLESAHWLYNHVGDARAEALGPCVVQPSPDSQRLAASLTQDTERAWVVSVLFAQGDLGDLVGHLKSLRYIQTQDGQRYYWRFADSRCLTALWRELTPAQQERASGPIHRWGFFDREGKAVDLSIAPKKPHPRDPEQSLSLLRITDRQLGKMLATVWPDQLLASVIEEQADIVIRWRAADRHACAQTVCDWLQKAGEDRYPIQQAVLRQTLFVAKPSWTEQDWCQAIQLAHQQACKSPS